MIQNSRLPQGYKESALGVIPKDWEVKRFSELFSLKNGINSEKENYGKGVKFVNTLDVLNSPYLTHKLIRGALVVNDEKIKEFAVQYGDILLNRTSETPNEIGYSTVPTQLRVYENKLTLWNHGTLPDGITLDKLTKPPSSFPRNPILAEACFRGGFIDAWGSGIMKIMDSCEMAGLPTPVIEEDCGGLIVRIFKDNLVEEQLVKLELNRRQVKGKSRTVCEREREDYE